MTAAIVINIHIMRSLILAMFICTAAYAGHSVGNGTCDDDITHWSNMIEKRSDAPLYEQSKQTQSEAMGKKITGKTEECETLMEEALRMIRKSGGQYPTE